MDAIFRTSRALRWSALCALIVAGLAGAPAQAADAACQYSEIATLPLGLLERSAAPVVQGSINDKPVQMLLDTGAQHTYLIKAEMDRQGLPMARQKRQIAGVGGSASMFLVRLRDRAVGPAHVSNANFSVVDALEKASYGALVGADFLSQADMEVSLADKQAKFFHAEGCKDKGLAYWDSNALDIPMESMSLQDQRQMFEVLINGQKVRAIIDTGAGLSVLSLAAAERAGVTPQSAGVGPAGIMSGIGSDKVPAYNAPFDRFSIGGETIKNPHIRIADWHQTQWFARNGPEMLLGRDFLKTHHVLLAMSQSRLYFSYLGGQVFLNPPTAAAGAPAVAPSAGHSQP